MHTFRGLVLALLMAVVGLAHAGPFAEATVTAGVTGCGWYLDTQTVPTIVAVTPPGTVCRYNLGGVSNGPHVIAADARSVDPMWGPLQSTKSVPLNFARPATSGVSPPSGLVLVP